MKRALLIAVVLLAGCAGVPRPDTAVAVYDFGVPEGAEGRTGTPMRNRLALEVSAVPWLDSPALIYRLAYEDALKRRQYAESRWASPPARLVAWHLVRRTGLVAAGGGVSAPCGVRLSLVEFSQVFETPQKSAAVVEGVADVVDGKRRLLATRTLRAEVDAGSADARGGAHALVAATDRLAEQLDGWLGRLEQGGDLESCGNR